MSRAATTPTRLDPHDLAALEEQRDFLLRSLADLEREHDAGDLDEHDYATLRDDYTARAAETLRAIDERRSAFAEARRRSGRGRVIVAAVAVVAFAVVAGLLVADSLGARKAGESASGGVTTKQSPSQQAQACISKLAPAAPSAAIDCFKAVLDQDPRNPVALAWLGWQLELSSGLAPADQADQLRRSASDLVDRAVESDPEYSYARAFRAVLAYRHGDYPAAKRYLADFRAHDPSPDAESVITSQDLDAKVEAALRGDRPTSSSSTTTPSSTIPG